MYRVIREFTDLQDVKATKSTRMFHTYRVGDIYPRAGYEPSKARITELMGADNLQGAPLIAPIFSSNGGVIDVQ